MRPYQWIGYTFTLFFILAIIAYPASAVILDHQNRLSITLEDGTVVHLLGQAAKADKKFWQLLKRNKPKTWIRQLNAVF
ncbi:MAG: hypothetical protein GKR87_13145 [Kiritimatiellae bacterium]|nr:hypothetical protein [Kiritimatiellia bacterium]